MTKLKALLKMIPRDKNYWQCKKITEIVVTSRAVAASTLSFIERF